MARLRPLEVLILSLVGPLCLFLVFWFFPNGFTGSDGARREPVGEVASRSRTGLVRVFQGELTGVGLVRVYQGCSPGLARGLPLDQARRRLGLDPREVPLTLLLCNPGTAPRTGLGPAWSLSQGGEGAWQWRLPAGDTLAGRLYSGPDCALPAQKVARHLFSGKSSPGDASMLLSGPGGETTLKPVELPAQELFRFPRSGKL